MTFEEFIARAKEARPRQSFAKELQQLYVDNGTLQVLVLMILQLRDDSMESLFGQHMISEDDIRVAIGRQGQVHGMNIILAAIHEAMTKEPEDDNPDVSVEQRSPVP